MSQLSIDYQRSRSAPFPFLAELRRRTAQLGGAFAAALASAALLFGLWALASLASGRDVPTPAETLGTFWSLLSNPFYDKGPNDKGIGISLVTSLGRVFTGFGLAFLVAVPVGILMGAQPIAQRVLNPVVQMLRPVSPLAWFPIGLASLHAAPSAILFVIFVTSLWPMMLNTSFGVASIPRGHRQVAQVFGFSRWKYVRKVVLPYSLPHILTGARLSMGIAWMVIVAGEMLAGGVGIGFFVWDSWNSLKVDRILSAILLIGLVGLLLDCVFDFAARRAAYQG